MNVFRIAQLTNLPNTQTGWGDSQQYDTSLVAQIKDPSGAPANKDITSIPTPWARIDLVKTAFRKVVESGNLEGATIYHRMVSDCFDVGEIFFNIDRLRDKFEIIEWNAKSQLQSLRASATSGHKLFGDTLQLYFNADAEVYNFDLVNSIYLLNYIGPNTRETINIVGATSPATLFFTPAGNLDYVTSHVTFGQDRPFDTLFSPLHKRSDENYILFWYAFREQWNLLGKRGFSVAFSEIDAYLNVVFSCLSSEMQAKVRDQQGLVAFFQQLPPLNQKAGNNASVVELLGLSLPKNAPRNVEAMSHFVVVPTNPGAPAKKPLIIPATDGTAYRKLQYTSAMWDGSATITARETRAVDERTLPADGTQYPYLSIDDFLESTLIVNEYAPNSERYFTGVKSTGNTQKQSTALLPIKPLYFDYFRVADLSQHLQIDWEELGNARAVRVTLSIPIKGNQGVTQVVFSRRYFTDADPMRNDCGQLLYVRFISGIFPFVKIEDKADYRIFLVDQNADCRGVYKVDFYAQTSPAPLAYQHFAPNTNPGSQSEASTNIPEQPHLFQVASTFDYLRIHHKGAAGIVVPIWTKPINGTDHRFAIDFGTTNTHIEGAVNSNACLSQEQLLATDKLTFAQLNIEMQDSLLSILDNDFFPSNLAQRYPFPRRTVLSYRKSINKDKWFVGEKIPYLHGNLPFVYESRSNCDYNSSLTNLKWSNSQENKEQVQLYLSSLFLTLRNRVLAEGADLANTQLTWFYPTSMPSNRVNTFAAIWDSLYEKYFGGDAQNNVHPVCEALAPLGYFIRKYQATEGICLVDIGGGTSDIVLADDSQPQLLTSLRFATGTLWGHGVNTDIEQNGFVKAFKAIVDERLKLLGASKPEFEELLNIENRICENGSSVDLINFWISLEKTTSTISFVGMLNEYPQFKPVFLLFYASIVYHVASIIKSRGLKVPRHFGFSGNGSRIFRALVDVQNRGGKEALTQFTQLLMAKVTGQNTERLQLIIVDAPKEITCQGGILHPISLPSNKVRDLQLSIWGDETGETISHGTTLSGITDERQTSAVNEVKHFFQILIELENEIRGGYADSFGTLRNPFNSIRKVMESDLEKHLRDALNVRRKEDNTNSDPELQESLFFLPIAGMLNQLAQHIAETTLVQ